MSGLQSRLGINTRDVGWLALRARKESGMRVLNKVAVLGIGVVVVAIATLAIGSWLALPLP